MIEPNGPQTTDLLTRGVQEVIEPKSLELKLHRSRPLRVKFGIDPTGFHVHIGHAVVLRKLRAWQKLGHTVVLIIGDYTARIGDPSGKDKARTALSANQVNDFAASYLDQIGKILDIKKTEVRYNSEWFDSFTVQDFLKLMGTMTVNQMIAHETFRQRLAKGQSLGIHELSYPLLQGYDSVMVEADVELGGLDQKFNLLTGRTVQQAHQQTPQDVMLMEYLVGTDGKQKMSKSLNNYIAIEDTPADMYGKTMSIPDKVIAKYYTLATDIPPEELAEIQKVSRSKKSHPRDLKARLAKELVRLYHGTPASDSAELEFDRVFRKKKAPSTMEKIEIRPGQHAILNLLVSQKLASSRSEARRLIEQGGIKIDNQTVTDWNAEITVRPGMVLQIGKRRFVELTTAT